MYILLNISELQLKSQKVKWVKERNPKKDDPELPCTQLQDLPDSSDKRTRSRLEGCSENSTSSEEDELEAINAIRPHSVLRRRTSSQVRREIP